jgi:molybdopterin converting factor small subunit
MSVIKILFFGQLVEKIGRSSLEMKDVDTTDQIIDVLKRQYPILNHHTYQIALDKEIISDNTPVTSGQVLALLPPYAGG